MYLIVQPMMVELTGPVTPFDPRKLFVSGEWRLICCQSRETLYQGQKMATFDGKIGTLEHAAPPAFPGATGNVYLRQNNSSHLTRLQPLDINAKWVDGDDIP